MLHELEQHEIDQALIAAVQQQCAAAQEEIRKKGEEIIEYSRNLKNAVELGSKYLSENIRLQSLLRHEITKWHPDPEDKKIRWEVYKKQNKIV